MNFYNFFKYFLSYLISVKNRQRLLLLSFVGLFLSSFSLLILQSSMGGLQNALITRSKNTLGSAVVYLDQVPSKLSDPIWLNVSERYPRSSKELQLEVLAKHHNFLFPLIIHGIDQKTELPEFLTLDSLSGIALPVGAKLDISSGESLQLISPSHLTSLLGDLPRSVSAKVTNRFATDVAEVDQFHAWTRISLLQNLVRQKVINRIRIYERVEIKELRAVVQSIAPNAIVNSWEDENGALVYALSLETKVMVFLFVAMTMLVALSISLALLVFFSRIKKELTTFYLLGLNPNRLFSFIFRFTILFNLLPIVLGLIFSTAALLLFRSFGAEILPDVFIDREIPILFSLSGYLVSFSVPAVISVLFSTLALRKVNIAESALKELRTTL